MGAIWGEKGCSGLSSEAARLMHTAVAVCECAFFCVYVPLSLFVSKPPNEVMSFQP